MIDPKYALAKVLDEGGLKSLVLEDGLDKELFPEVDKLVVKIQEAVPFLPKEFLDGLAASVKAAGRSAVEAFLNEQLAKLKG